MSPVISTSDLTDRIYDTLMENVGFSEFHVPFPVERVANQFCDAQNRIIYLELDGKAYNITVEETKVLED